MEIQSHLTRALGMCTPDITQLLRSEWSLQPTERLGIRLVEQVAGTAATHPNEMIVDHSPDSEVAIVLDVEVVALCPLRARTRRVPQIAPLLLWSCKVTSAFTLSVKPGIDLIPALRSRPYGDAVFVQEDVDVRLLD